MKKIYSVILSVSVLTAGMLFLFSSDSEAQVDPLTPSPPSITLPAGMEFVTIPSGSFQMGSPSSESGRSSDESQHIVSIGSFELMTTEVTQGMWEEVMGTTVSEMQSLSEYDCGLSGYGPDHPMCYISWNDCQDFIAELNDLDASHTYRLPSEAEWEYACRAGTVTRFYWGDSDSESVMGRYCWYCENSNRTHPVGQNEPNAWGLYDMSGNISEWCQDVYASDYDDCPTDGSAYTGLGSDRILRGGWGKSSAHDCSSACRSPFEPGFGYIGQGFRLARSML